MIIGKISTDWAKRAGLPYWYNEETSSTNEMAKEQALTEKENIRLYFTDFQSRGRGRGENQWITGAAGTALLASWSFQVQKSPQPILSPLIGLALFRAATATFPQLDFSLKAPNDLLLGEKKVAGLLIENLVIGNKNRLIIGLGINVYESPSSVDGATHLSENLEDISSQDWGQFLDRLLLEFTMALAGAGNTLPISSQQALLYALNLNPNLPAPYTNVSAHGDLELAGQTISWSQL